jgi:hypothetical protein
MPDASTSVDGLSIANVIDRSYIQARHAEFVAEYQKTEQALKDIETQRQQILITRERIVGVIGFLTHLVDNVLMESALIPPANNESSGDTA